MDKTRVCPVHGTVLWRGQRCPDCKGSKGRYARTAAISAVAAAISTMGALAIWPVPAAIPGAVAVYATCLLLTHRTRSTS